MTAPYSSKIRVVLADDQDLVRGSFALLVNSVPDMAVVGEAATGREAVAVPREHPGSSAGPSHRCAAPA